MDENESYLIPKGPISERLPFDEMAADIYKFTYIAAWIEDGGEWPFSVTASMVLERWTDSKMHAQVFISEAGEDWWNQDEPVN